METLLSLLKAPSEQARLYAVQALADRRLSKTVLPLTALLEDPDPRVRAAAAEALRRIGDLRAAEAMQAALRDPEPRIRRTAALALGEMRVRRAAKPLLPLLQDPVPEVQKAAAWSLMRVCARKTLHRLVALLDEPVEASVRVEIISGLARCPARLAVPALLRVAARREEQNLYLLAQRSLQRLPLRPRGRVLARVARNTHEDIPVRTLAVRELGRIPLPWTARRLRRLLRRDPVPEVRAAAAEALGRAGFSAAYRALAAALKDHPLVAFTALRTLTRLLPQAPPRIIRKLLLRPASGPPSLLRAVLSHALRHPRALALGPEDAPQLARHLASQDPKVRWLTARLLGRLRNAP